MILFDDIFSVYKNWNFIDREEFYRYRLSKNKSNDFRLLQTSGSSSCRVKNYKWGPEFHKHYLFYNSLFYNNQKHLYLSLMSHSENSYIRYSEDRLSLFFLDSIPKNNDSLIKDTHICCNPEVLYLFLNRYGDFLDYFFDIKTCIFCFTGSPLTPIFKNRFINLKIKDFMRCWDGGATYFTCQNFNKHWVDFSSIIKISDKKLISTDLWNTAEKFINYWNNDELTSIKTGDCDCGFNNSYEIEWEENPRYFEIKNNQFSYDGLSLFISKYLLFDLLYFEVSNSLVIVNICTLFNFNEKELADILSEKLGTKTIVRMSQTFPSYKRKYNRIKKLYKSFI